MATTYHAGRRIQTTSTDFGCNGAGIPGVTGGWKELGRTTLGSANSSMSVSSLSDKRYYMVLTSVTGQASNSDVGISLNGDTGSNYARRFSTNGGSDITGTVTSLPYHYTDIAQTTPIFAMGYLANKSDKEKLSISHGVRQTGTTAGVPSKFESVGKWANTSNAINEIEVLGSTNFNTGSETVVLGWDPSDTHSTNFWEELADITLCGDASEISSGTITAKKYLWVQVYFHNASNSDDVLVRFNNDTGSNYAHRHSINYGACTTGTSQTSARLIDRNGSADTGRFVNFFIINNSANEKLIIAHGMEEETAGAGNPPTSNESVAKWANTSDQITEIDCFTNSGNIRSGARLKVWGSD